MLTYQFAMDSEKNVTKSRFYYCIDFPIFLSLTSCQLQTEHNMFRFVLGRPQLALNSKYNAVSNNKRETVKFQNQATKYGNPVPFQKLHHSQM